MIRRPRRSVAASVVALLVLVTCAAVVTSCVQILLGQAPFVPFSELARLGAGLTGAGVEVLVACAVLALAGLVLLVVALRPGNPTVVPLTDAGTGVETGLARRGLDRALAGAATSIDGITRAGVRTRGRRSTVTAHAAFGDPAEQRTAVHDAVTARLDGLHTARPHRVRVRITTAKEA